MRLVVPAPSARAAHLRKIERVEILKGIRELGGRGRRELGDRRKTRRRRLDHDHGRSDELGSVVHDDDRVLPLDSVVQLSNLVVVSESLTGDDLVDINPRRPKLARAV